MMKSGILFTLAWIGSLLAASHGVAALGQAVNKPVAVISDPTVHQLNITSHGVTLGVSSTGGGYANFLDLGDGKNLIAAAYGRGWQVSIRDQLHGGLYNPTQAGAGDPAGTPAVLTLSASTNGPGQRVDIHPFAMPLFLNPGFNFALGGWRNFPPGTVDTDGLDESGITLREELTSEFNFSGFYQDASGLANNSIPVFQYDFSMQYARNPGPAQWEPGHPYSAIYQFGPKAKTENGKPVLNPTAQTNIGGVHFPSKLATDTDLSYGEVGAGLRLVYSAGYHTEMWLNEEGKWRSASLDEKQSMAFPIYAKHRCAACSSFAVLVKGDDPKTSPAVGLYVPQSSPINVLDIVGTDVRTGKRVYTEGRRITWTMKSNRFGPADPDSNIIRPYEVDGVPIENHMTILRPWLSFTGLLAPSHGLPNVVESLRGEEFVLIGTPDQIRDAVEQIRKKLLSSAARDGGVDR